MGSTQASAAPLLLVALLGCSRLEQEGHLRSAVEMLGKCEFREAIERAEDAMRVGGQSELRYAAGLVKAKAYEALGDESEANETYTALASEHQLTAFDVRSAADNLDHLVDSCE